jgi:hypothetical protein
VQSESLVHGLDTQCPIPSQLSFEPQSLAVLHAGTQLPLLPLMPHTQGPPGPHTIGSGGAASWIVAQSESVLQGFCGIAQIPQPVDAPPGLHDRVDGQSVFEWQAIAPSDGPPSPGHPMLLSTMLHAPALHVAVTAHP